MGKYTEDLNLVKQIMEDLKKDNVEFNITNMRNHPLFGQINHKEIFLDRYRKIVPVRAVTKQNTNKDIALFINGINMNLSNKEDKKLYDHAVDSFIRELLFIKEFHQSSAKNAIHKLSNFREWFKNTFGKRFLN